MASDEPSGARPGPVVLRIKLRYEDVDTMVHRFAPNVGKTGLFLPTKSLQPVGTEIKFELRLANDKPVLVGLGRVKAVREPDPANPRATFGIAIELMRVTRESRDVILRMLERRRQMGLAETSVPMPADIEAARRSDFIDTGIRDMASGAVPAVVSQTESSAPVLTAPRQSGPIAVARTAPVVQPLAPEAPRRRRPPLAELIESASGPISTGQVAGLDDEVDVGAILARARMLAGSDLDGELAALLESAAAPVALDIEAASAELARQLGGAAVRRDRSARWAPPPVVEVPKVEVAARAPVPAAPEPAAPVVDAIVDASAAGHDAAPAPITAVDEGPVPVALVAVDEAVELDRPSRQSFAPANVEIRTDPHVSSLIHDDADPDAFVAAGAAAGAAARADDGDDAQEVEPDQIHDEIHQLAEGDYEEVEHTQLGVDPNAFDEHAYATVPSEDHAGLAARLDERLAEAEAEADADDLGIAPASFDRFDDDPGDRVSLEGVPYDERAEAPGDDVIPLGEPRRVPAAAEVSDDDRALEQALEQDLAGALEQDLTRAPDLAVPDEHHEELDELEELHDFEILAEADAEDEDLLAAQGEREISAAHAAQAATDDAQRPSFMDFAARLDLDDDGDGDGDGVHAIPTAFAPRASFDPREVSAGHALAAFTDPEPADEPNDGSFTLPGDAGLDDVHDDYGAAPGFPALHAFDQSDVISIAPPPPGDVYGGDLESALEQLDVDLDDIAANQPTGPSATELLPERAYRDRPAAERPARAPRNRPPSSLDEPVTKRSPARLAASPGSSVRTTGKSRLVGMGRVAPLAKPERPPRATTDDGVLINFDDDDDD